MAVKWVTGVLGAGKGLYCNYEMKKYYREGRRVVTNYPVDTYLLDADSDNPVTVLPAHPRVEDFKSLGRGCPDDEKEKFGAIFLDEVGTWLNSRTFADKSRLGLIDWFIHSRHLGWDVFIMVQNEDMVDKQVAIATGEILVLCKRSDRMQGIFFKLIKKLLFSSKDENRTKGKNNAKNVNANSPLTPAPQTKQTGLFRHRVIVETYFQRKSKRDKPFDKFSFFANDYFGIHDTNHIFEDGFEILHFPNGDVKRVDMRAVYSLLPGKTIAQWYYANTPMIKTPLISKWNLFKLIFFGTGTLLSWHYLIGDKTVEATVTTQTYQTNGNNFTPANAQGQTNLADDGTLTSSLPAPPPPLPLSNQWRLTGYLKSSSGLPRYVIRDNAGNVRYIASEKPWEGTYSEIEVDGERITFWTGSQRTGNERHREGSSSPIDASSVLSTLTGK